jgi:hypothetical protein
MKIQCDVCDRAPATVICCADEAALCAKCDVEVHAANKLASKHQRLHLDSFSNKLPLCDICKEKPAFIFCVEDRALFCQDCDEPIHSANSLSANHQRFLATGIKVALSASPRCSSEIDKTRQDPPKNKEPQVTANMSQQQPSSFGSSWGVDEFLQFSDLDSSDKLKDNFEFGELDWIAEIGMFGDQIPQEAIVAAEVPEISLKRSNNYSLHRSSKSNLSSKKTRFEFAVDDGDYFTVPDLG